MGKDQVKAEVIRALEGVPYLDRISSVSLFGSYLHGDNTEKSDVDLLIDFHRAVGLLEVAKIRRILSERLGRQVDLVTPSALSRYFRDKVLKEAEKIYG